ncbi:retrotransposon ty3-gypsy subclass [Penicillium digitatum]|uniref:Retrotransposon ty3-gypsy subclass n=1 Tax=Penicillium digitatum TaxID=36651 RepID=A0A7T6XTT7_PENDI|nr:retrotransposon ty3-gypsy subclass [Penicillium digitatum]
MAQGTPTWGKLNLMTKVGGFAEAEWYAATIQYLSAGSLPSDKMLRKEVMRWASKLAIHESPLPAAATQEENTRLRFLHGDGSSAPYLEPPFRKDFLKRMHEETTTPYHPRTNGKVENFNGLLGRMLTKYCMGKPTRVWDLYLAQALFATRVREHATSGKSPFYLVYGIHPRLPGDTELVTSIRGPAELDNKIMAVNHARAEANEALLHKAIRAQKIQDEKVTTCSLQPGKWGIGPQRSKAEVRVAMVRTVQDPKSTPPRHVRTRRTWGASTKELGGKYQLRRKGLDIRHPLDGGEIIDTDSETPPSYHELATISRAEWDAMERSGVRSRLVGREEVLRHVVTKTRKQPSATKKGENMVPAPEAEEAPGTGFTPTEQVEESQPRDWNPAHKADERTEEAPGTGFTPTEQVE